MADTNGTYRVQYAALPYRVRQDGEVQLRLVTSRETRRWVIPKGWPMKGIPPHKAAAREAYEEAGLLGSIASTPIGIYRYDKRLSLTRSVLCEVMVFPMKVKRYLKKWPERAQRVGFWFSIETAASVVQEPELASLILEFGAVMAERQAEKLAKLEAVAQAKAAEAPPKKKAAPKKVATKKAGPEAPEAGVADGPAMDAVATPVAKVKPAKAKAATSDPAKDQAKDQAKDPDKDPAKAAPKAAAKAKATPKVKAAPKAKAKTKAAAAPMGPEAATEAVIPSAAAPAAPAVAEAEQVPAQKAPAKKTPAKKAPAKKVRAKKAKGRLDAAARTAAVTVEPAPPAKAEAKSTSKSKAEPATPSPAEVRPRAEKGAAKDASEDASPAHSAARKTAPVKKKAAARKPEGS